MITEKELKGINSPFRNFSLNLKINSYKRQLEKLHIKIKDLTILDAGVVEGLVPELLLANFLLKK